MVAALSCALPFALDMHALKHLSKRSFSILLSLEPAVGAVAGWVMLSEGLALQQWLAIALVMTASMGSAWSVRTNERAPNASDQARCERCLRHH